MKYNNFEYEVKYGLAKITSYKGNETKVEIPEKIDKYNVYTIDSEAFFDLSNLKEVIIPKSVGCIKKGAFTACENLQKIKLFIIEEFENPFIDCSDNIVIETPHVTMANRISKLNDETLNVECIKDFKYKILNEKNKTCILERVKIRSNNLIIPDEIDGYKITRLGFSLKTLFGKKSINNLKLPKYLEEIPIQFFYDIHLNCTITIPDFVKEIGTNAFTLTDSTKKDLVIPKSVKKINSYAFSNCRLNISFEENTILQELGNYSFHNATIDFKNVKKFDLSKNNIFKFSYLKYINLTSQKTIGDSVFQNCTIENVRGLKNIETLGDRVFYGTKFKKTIHFDLSKIKTIGQNCFKESNFDSFYIPTNLILKPETFASSYVTKVKFADDYKGTELPYRCFYNCKFLRKVNLPKNITKIGESCFYSCSNLEKVNIDKIKEFLDCSFCQTGITNLKFDSNVEKIGGSAFQYCRSLKKVEYTDDCTLNKIENSTFYNCSNLKKVKLSKNIKVIGNYAFYCSSLEDINLEEIENINAYALAYNLMKSINLRNCKEIKDNAFYNSRNLKEVLNTENIENIERYAFARCMKLNNFKISNKIKTIRLGTFSETGITSIELPDSIEKLENNAFSNCNKLERIKFGKNIKKIPTGTIYLLPNLKELTINAEEICGDAIRFCEKLETIKLTNNVKRLGINAISNCANLKYASIEGKIDDLGLHVFNNCPNLTEIHTNDIKTGKKLISRKKNSIEKVISL